MPAGRVGRPTNLIWCCGTGEETKEGATLLTGWPYVTGEQRRLLVTGLGSGEGKAWLKKMLAIKDQIRGLDWEKAMEWPAKLVEEKVKTPGWEKDARWVIGGFSRGAALVAPLMLLALIEKKCIGKEASVVLVLADPVNGATGEMETSALTIRTMGLDEDTMALRYKDLWTWVGGRVWMFTLYAGYNLSKESFAVDPTQAMAFEKAMGSLQIDEGTRRTHLCTYRAGLYHSTWTSSTAMPDLSQARNPRVVGEDGACPASPPGARDVYYASKLWLTKPFTRVLLRFLTVQPGAWRNERSYMNGWTERPCGEVDRMREWTLHGMLQTLRNAVQLTDSALEWLVRNGVELYTQGSIPWSASENVYVAAGIAAAGRWFLGETGDVARETRLALGLRSTQEHMLAAIDLYQEQ